MTITHFVNLWVSFVLQPASVASPRLSVCLGCDLISPTLLVLLDLLFPVLLLISGWFVLFVWIGRLRLYCISCVWLLLPVAHAKTFRLKWICKKAKIMWVVVVGMRGVSGFHVAPGSVTSQLFVHILINISHFLCRVEGTRWCQLSSWTAAISGAVWHLSLKSLLSWKHADIPWVFAASLGSQLGKQCINDTGFDPSVEQTQAISLNSEPHMDFTFTNGLLSYLCRHLSFWVLFTDNAPAAGVTCFNYYQVFDQFNCQLCSNKAFNRDLRNKWCCFVHKISFTPPSSLSPFNSLPCVLSSISAPQSHGLTGHLSIEDLL